MKLNFYLVLFTCLLFSFNSHAQTPGIVVRPAGTSGPLVLDPNADGYTSITTAGFGTDDILKSEILYKIVPFLTPEPSGDLLRGPSGSYSDIEKTTDGSGFYLFNDGTNLLCRLRIGGIVSGSKGYSLLLDTDGKFGNIGANADLNYLPATTGNNGNPGFELEVVFESNFRIAIYNVDGTSTPVLLNSYPLAANSQISVASTTVGGNPDYFYDFYVPLAALGISNSTPIHVCGTTVMSPGPAVGGPKSDIFGVYGGDYMTQWVNVITGQPPFTLNDLTATGTAIKATCTNAPFLNSPILPSSTTVTGTWTKSSYSSNATATITLYNNGVAFATTTATSGNTWSVAVSSLTNNSSITAKAQASGESNCLASNVVIISACNTANRPATPILCVSNTKGITGSNLSTGWTVHADNASTNTFDNSGSTTGSFLASTNTGTSPNITWQYSGGCSGGRGLASGSYKIYYTNDVTGCASEVVNFCIQGTGQNALAGSVATPVISTPANGVYTPATNTISGTTTAAATMQLYINGYVAQTVTAGSGGVFTFANLSLLVGQSLHITGEINGASLSTSYCATETTPVTVACFTASPLITVSNSNTLFNGLPVSGTSGEATGTIIKVYTSASALVSTTTVQSDGTWSANNAGSVPASYNALTGTSYYATAQNGSCAISANSSSYNTTVTTSMARCGTINSPVAENATTVSGTLTGSLAGTVVTLYVDGTAAGTNTTSNAAWSIAVNTTPTNTIYAGATLTIGITEPSTNGIDCSASVIVSCTSLTTPAVSPASSTINKGQKITYTISSPQSGILYSIRDNADANNSGASGFGSGASVTLLSDAFNTVGTYTIKIKATNFSGSNCTVFSTATVTVTETLPVSLINFDGKYNNGSAKLQWSTATENALNYFELQKSYTNDNFKKYATIKAVGNSQSVLNYAFTDSSVKGTTVYYRLKMVDVDNVNFKYSKVVAFRVGKGVFVNAIAPNPFTNTIKIKADVIEDVALTITLNDIAGRKIKTINYAAKSGMNNISVTDLNSLVKGTYIIEIKAAGEKISRQLLIK